MSFLNQKKNGNELFNLSMMPNTENLDYLTKSTKIGKGHLWEVIKIIVSHYYHRSIELWREIWKSCFLMSWFILIQNYLLTELKGTKNSLSESFQEAITNEYIWHLNIFGSKWQVDGFHQFSNLAFLITSAANKDVKYWRYIGEGCSNFSKIPVWWFIKSL